MISNNVTTVSFGPSRKVIAHPLWQYDYGQILKIEGLALPEAYEVHFSLTEAGGTSVEQIGNADGVIIPDALLLVGTPIYAFIFLHTGTDDGETEYKITIPVKARPKPSEEEPTPVQQDAITQAIAALNTAVDEAEGIRDAIPETVNTALEAAKASGEFDGPKGDKGDTGERGEAGPAGPQGVPGETGATGPKGERGEKGDTGETGAQGPKGETGATGESGQDGVSPTITVTDITGGHRVTITDATGAHSFDVMDGSGGEAPVQDVQVNGTSILDAQGVANVPAASSSTLGVVKYDLARGTEVGSDGKIGVKAAGDSSIKIGSGSFQPIVPTTQHRAAFYGLAKAAGDATQSASSNPVGTYTEDAKSAISEMLGGSVAVSGTAPTITAKSGIRYVCGEVSTLDITLPASGIVDVVFTSGSTPTVLTITPPTGQTVKWANGFDPTNLDADTTYEINIADGLGVAASWT